MSKKNRQVEIECLESMRKKQEVFNKQFTSLLFAVIGFIVLSLSVWAFFLVTGCTSTTDESLLLCRQTIYFLPWVCTFVPIGLLGVILIIYGLNKASEDW